MCIYKSFIRPFLFKFDPEKCHYLAHNVIAHFIPLLALLPGRFCYKKDDLRTSVFEKILSNPVGLAAGFDKNGDLIHSLSYLGFGYAEIGSVSAQAHQGNPRPRLWRLPADKALINWMGLNSEGAIQIAQKLASSKFSLPVGINIVKSNKVDIKGDEAVADLVFTFRAIRYLPFMYVVINVSCVNTAEGILQETSILSSFLEKIANENPKQLPILVKVSEDSNDELIEKIVEIGKRFSLAGFICGNTSRQRPPLKTDKKIVDGIENGGLSGPPIKQLVLPLCRKVYKLKKPEQIIIANGGISSGQDAYDYIRAGASLVQLYTALIYEGPSVICRICEELAMILEKEGLTLADAVGSDSVFLTK